MDELKKALIMVTVLGLFVTSLGLFINSFVSNYSLPNQDIEKYNYLDEMIQSTNETENSLKGIDTLQDEDASAIKKFTSLSEFILSNAFNSIINGLKSLTYIYQIFVNLAEDLRVPTSILLGAFSIIVLGIIFGLAKLLIQVFQK